MIEVSSMMPIDCSTWPWSVSATWGKSFLDLMVAKADAAGRPLRPGVGADRRGRLVRGGAGRRGARPDGAARAQERGQAAPYLSGQHAGHVGAGDGRGGGGRRAAGSVGGQPEDRPAGAGLRPHRHPPRAWASCWQTRGRWSYAFGELDGGGQSGRRRAGLQRDRLRRAAGGQHRPPRPGRMRHPRGGRHLQLHQQLDPGRDGARGQTTRMRCARPSSTASPRPIPAWTSRAGTRPTSWSSSPTASCASPPPWPTCSRSSASPTSRRSRSGSTRPGVRSSSWWPGPT